MHLEERFPRLVNDLASLDCPVREQFKSLPAQAQLNQILVLPPIEQWVERKNWRRWLYPYRVELTPERTIVLTDSELWIASRLKGTEQITCTTIPLNSLLTFDLGTVLLRGWLQITWNSPGGHQQMRLDFNTVGFRLVRRLLASLQQALLVLAPPVREDSILPPGEVESLPLKFLNILKLDVLLTRELPLALVFEASVPPRWIFGLGGHEGKLWVVTNEHCLLIREPPDLYPYGQVTTICPRHRVCAAELMENEQGIELRISLGETGYIVKTRFKTEHMAELQATTEILKHILIR